MLSLFGGDNKASDFSQELFTVSLAVLFVSSAVMALGLGGPKRNVNDTSKMSGLHSLHHATNSSMPALRCSRFLAAEFPKFVPGGPLASNLALSGRRPLQKWSPSRFGRPGSPSIGLLPRGPWPSALSPMEGELRGHPGSGSISALPRPPEAAALAPTRK